MWRWPLALLLCLALRLSAQTLLLVDDHDVLYRSGTHRVLNPPVRYAANPLIKPDHPWEVEIAWTSVYRNPQTGKYQLWYQSWNNTAREKSNACVVCYAESDDGIHFNKPLFDLFPFNDAKKTNIVLIGNGGHSYRYGACVNVDPNDPDPSRRYKMAYFDWAKDEGQEYPGLCVAFSPDGIHWTKYPKAPLSRAAYVDYEEPLPYSDQSATRPWAVPMSMADAVDVMFDPTRKTWVWYGKMWIDGPAGGMAWKHAMGRCESNDYIHWSKPALIATPDDRDPPELEFHTSPVFYHAGVYICLNQILNRAKANGTVDIELMTSRDGIHFDRNFRDQKWLPLNPKPNTFDSGSIFTNSTPIIVRDEMRFYYGGYRGGATGGDEDLSGISGIGLATLPLNRFAGVTPVDRSAEPTLKHPLNRIGQITFRPRDLSRVKSITINADATNGSIRAEILDENGRIVRGYSASDAKLITGDSLRHRVIWPRATKELPAGQYHLRLHLERATVYAVDLEPLQ